MVRLLGLLHYSKSKEEIFFIQKWRCITGIKKISVKNVKVKKLIGRDMKLMITPESCGSVKLTFGIIWVPVGSITKPCHSHLGAEEVIYICKGNGEAWVDGDITAFAPGDAILFPSGSKHMIRNTDDETCEVICVYSPPTSPENYRLYPEIKFN